MDNMIIVLGSSLILETLFLILFICFYKYEKEKLRIEMSKRAEDRAFMIMMLGYLEKRSESYEILLEYKNTFESQLSYEQSKDYS